MIIKGNGKAVPLQVSSGPEGSKKYDYTLLYYLINAFS
jgi:hypothetical protein